MTTPTTVQIQLQIRADTAANWTSVNPLLLANEVALETDTKKIKVGDGSTYWSGLPYFPSIVSGGTLLGNLEIGSTGTLTFEGATANTSETTLGVVDPTADRTILLPDQSGTVVVSGNASITDADIAANAEIAVSKLANGTANQVLVTDGTDVSWSDNLTLAGDLTVNGTTTTINTETLTVKDKNIELAVVDTPTDVTADGGGITLKGATDKTINWIDATDAWTSSERFSVPLGTAGAPSLTFTGDENTGIYSPGTDQLALSTNGTGRLFVDASGNVGVGVESPSERLEVNGNIYASPNTGGVRNIGVADSSNTTVVLRAGAASGIGANIELLNSGNIYLDGVEHRFRGTDGSSERLRITSAGLVGIGTSSPQKALDVYADSGLIVHSTNSNSVETPLFIGGGATSQRKLALIGKPVGTWARQDLLICSNNVQDASEVTSADAVVTIKSTGNVGIGTTSPDAKLEVVADSTGSVELARLRIEGQTNNPMLRIFADEANQTVTLDTSGSVAGTELVFKEGGSEAARIDSSGRLLVGTSTSLAIGSPTNAQIQQANTSSTPNLALANFVNASAGSYLILGASRGTSIGSYTAVANNDRIASIRFAAADGTDLQSLAGSIECYAEADAASNDTPGRLVFSTNPGSPATAPVERMRIKNAGSISCYQTGSDALVLRTSQAAGTTNKLITGVHSGTGVDTGGTACFYVRTNGNVENTNNSYGAISDIKLKENIVDASSQWSDIKTLQVRNYNFKEGQTHTQIGLIAQEVELVSPGLVSESPDLDEDGNDLGTVTKSINYSVLYMKAVKALQEAMERIETLEAKVAALEAS